MPRDEVPALAGTELPVPPDHAPTAVPTSTGPARSPRLRRSPGVTLPRHWHAEEQIVVVLDGPTAITIGGETGCVGAGAASVVPPAG